MCAGAKESMYIVTREHVCCTKRACVHGKMMVCIAIYVCIQTNPPHTVHNTLPPPFIPLPPIHTPKFCHNLPPHIHSITVLLFNSTLQWTLYCLGLSTIIAQGATQIHATCLCLCVCGGWAREYTTEVRGEHRGDTHTHTHTHTHNPPPPPLLQTTHHIPNKHHTQQTPLTLTFMSMAISSSAPTPFAFTA